MIKPTFAPFPVRTALVATVVPCITCATSDKSISDWEQIRFIPSNTPIDESSGVEGTFAVYVCPLESSTKSKSVKVPPTSTPSLKAVSYTHLTLPTKA